MLLKNNLYYMSNLENILEEVVEISTEIDSIEQQIEDKISTLRGRQQELAQTLTEKTTKARNIILKDNKETVEEFENAGAEYIFTEFENTDDVLEIVEDDGILEITRGKIRGCFICDQELTRGQFNKLAREIMDGLEISRKQQALSR